MNNKIFKIRGMRNSVGFTLIEIMVVIAVLLLVSALSIGSFSLLNKKTEIDSAKNNLTSTLNKAKNKTLASEGPAQYGIYFNIVANPDQYVFFQGPSYASRNINFDEIYNLPKTINIANLSLNVSGNEVVFNRLDGNTNNYGFLSLESSSANETRTIYIYKSGEIGDQSESVSGTGRISDSRHVHFDLGWNISGATTLKFNFINRNQTEFVSIAGYFIGNGFDWEGQFTINDKIQKFKIHTHQLDPTILCIHRDRNNGENNEEVYIYINQNSVDKEIAHYDDDQYATIYKGLYVWDSMEKQ
jgi:prepilin-type N-terminal cleavage/methylation domain-containing protein